MKITSWRKMMENKSGLRPLGKAVLVQPYEEQRRAGKIEIPDFAKDRMAMVDNKAIVVALGDDAWADERTPRAKPGDKVLITKFAGFMAEGVDGHKYRLVNDIDIFCALEASHG